LLDAEFVKSLTRTEAVIRTPLFAEPLESWRIGIEALWLDIWTIWTSMSHTLIGYESEDIMSIEYSIDRSLDEPSTIGILYTYYIRSLIVVRPEIAVERSTQWSDMQVSSRWWSETGTDGHRDEGLEFST
jgi:hypothetical protein